SRVSSVLAVGLMSALGLGLLTWYYAKTLTRPAQAQRAAQAAVKSRAQGEMPLPHLPPIAAPVLRTDPPPPPAPASDGGASAVERILGSAPSLPPEAPAGTAVLAAAGAP